MLRLEAPCKINLLLQVTGRRADGYHELVTWMQKLDLCDELLLQLRPVPGIALHCDTPSTPAAGDNLAWRAARLFFERSRRGRGMGVEIGLVKRIPVGAGLGGGSSDAGTVLRGLNALFDQEFTETELVKLATGLGADVPFFAVAHSAVLATGIGEVMTPVAPLADCTFLLVNPGFAVSTKWVFDNFTLTSKGEHSTLFPSRNHGAPILSLSDMRNDLEFVTSRAFPEIEQMKERALEAGACTAMMSGSGPTVFGVFPDDSYGQVTVSDVTRRFRLQKRERIFVVRAHVGA
ncbi:MAG: 4-(cytidine 5'-diphospho)-2-C-methyl-D-erythritol kinase [Desulfopila sp.]